MAISHNRIPYQNQVLYIGPSPATGGHFMGLQGASATPQKVAENQGSGNLIRQLYRIQSVSINPSLSKVPVYQFGEQAAIDKVILDPPTVGLSFSYLLANMYNESGLGFHTQGLYTCISGFLDKSQDERNYWLGISPEGEDAIGSTVSDINTFTYGVGNGFITSYSTQGSVGGFPSVDISVEGMNMAFDTGISGWIPAIVPVDGSRMTGFRYLLPTASGSPGTGNLDISVLRPGDITLDFRERSATDEGTQGDPASAYATEGVSISDAHIQSYNLSLNLGRESMRRLGSRFAFSREISFPIQANLSVDAIVTNIITGSWSDHLTCDKTYNVIVNIKKPACVGDPQPVVARYIVRNAELVSQSYSSDIGSNQRVTLNWSAEIGSARQTGIGVFFSGVSFHV